MTKDLTFNHFQSQESDNNWIKISLILTAVVGIIWWISYFNGTDQAIILGVAGTLIIGLFLGVKELAGIIIKNKNNSNEKRMAAVERVQIALQKGQEELQKGQNEIKEELYYYDPEKGVDVHIADGIRSLRKYNHEQKNMKATKEGVLNLALETIKDSNELIINCMKELKERNGK
jgi:hypothetical protein